jgi:hypothetical protein
VRTTGIYAVMTESAVLVTPIPGLSSIFGQSHGSLQHWMVGALVNVDRGLKPVMLLRSPRSCIMSTTSRYVTLYAVKQLLPENMYLRFANFPNAVAIETHNMSDRRVDKNRMNSCARIVHISCIEPVSF